MRVALFVVLLPLTLGATLGQAQNYSPMLAGFGRLSKASNFKARFPTAACTQYDLGLGNDQTRSISCSAQGKYLGKPAEFKASFREDGMTGLAVHVPAAVNPKQVAVELRNALTATIGPPTEDFLASVEEIQRNSGIGARWIFQPTALVSMRVCGAGVYQDNVLCRDSRVVIDLMYNTRQ